MMDSASISKREIYRLKNGRFARKNDLWQGVPKPMHIIYKEMSDIMCGPNLILERLRSSGRVRLV